MSIGENEKGFTLIELIVVVAIMGIITAVLVPQYQTMSLRSRMRADIDSVKIVQEQVEIYYNDKGKWPGSTAEEVISRLTSDDYLNSKYLSVSTIRLETRGALVSYDTNVNRLKLKVSPEQYNVFNHETDKENWLVSGS